MALGKPINTKILINSKRNLYNQQSQHQMEPEEYQPCNPRYLKPATIQKSFLSQKFVNPFPIWKQRSLRFDKVLSFFYNNYQNQPSIQSVSKLLPSHKPDFSQPPIGITKVIWISHATVLIQDGPVNILTDPVFANSVPEPIGYKRLIKIPAILEQFPTIHIVLISHDHKDHFDERAVQRLIDRDKPLIVMGLKSEDLLAKSKNYTVMDWCSKYEYEVKGRKYEIHFLPSCHWSGRGVFDHFKRLWGSFLLITPEKKKIYYPGDTGYCKELFQEINQRYGDIDCCLLPIGAYEPREFLCFQHINPEEAVFIHYHLKSRQSLGVHWGTFQLACEGFLQPREDLEKVLKREEIYKENNGNFCCVEPGQSLILGIDVTTPFFDVSQNIWVTWLGHSSILIQFNSTYILVDPFFQAQIFHPSQKSPIHRLTHPTSLHNAPQQLDIVLLTNSTPRYRQLTKAASYTRNGVVYLDSDSASQKYDDKFVTMANKEVREFRNVKVKMFSGKGDCAFVLTLGRASVVVYGAYADPALAEEIRADGVGQVDMAFIPIRPLIGFKDTKVKQSDWEAIIKTHRKLEPKKSIAVNWGAFKYPGDKTILQPKEEFIAETEKHKVNSSQFLCCPIGKTLLVPNSYKKDISNDY